MNKFQALKNLATNVELVFGTFAFRKPQKPFFTSALDVVAAFLFWIIASTASDVMLYGGGSYLLAYLPEEIGELCFGLGAAIVFAAMTRQSEIIRALCIGAPIAYAFGVLVTFPIELAARLGITLPFGDLFASWLPIALAAAFVATMATGTLVRKASVTLPIVLGLFGLPYATYAMVYGWPFADDAESEQAYEIPDTEAIYAAQPGLLEAQFKALAPGDPNVPELFAVLGAGYPYQDLFKREISNVSTILAGKFGTQNRTVLLANMQHNTTDLPLLNRTNLSAVLQEVGSRMDEDDIMFLFMTSHGSKEALSTSFYGVNGRNLSSEDVAAALEKSGIRNAVIAISSCYSGSFIDELSGPGRLIITAAAADRTSFGCSDENEWTDWSRVFFTQALSETDDFREAASIAQLFIASEEATDRRKPSQPQVFEGEAIGSALDNWLEARPYWLASSE